ncbi:hypothetical protein JOQ06_018633 [Pogonophryne albipinna]|uniref:Secreted protein n=1 Tax=Pogonophryne albipinna TaxID=1090488 RepID=A0AAD6FD81_9TELE|nr:hypothetical protein JOQ06_018633 [Pogonophryne albipinna]
MFKLSVGGVAALFSQLLTTVSVTHWGIIEHHDYCSKKGIILVVIDILKETRDGNMKDSIALRNTQVDCCDLYY